MSERPETLFSFEILVENVRLERQNKVFHELVLGVRLLDFPTLLIYQADKRRGVMELSQQKERSKLGEYIFNKGKSCFFKMNWGLINVQLSNRPLCVMVWDGTDQNPRFVGSSLISLAKVMDRIKQDVTKYGFSNPSAHREKGLVAIYNVTGEKIGTISLRYKLVSLGASLMPHITEKREYSSTSVPRSQQQQQHNKDKNKPPESICRFLQKSIDSKMSGEDKDETKPTDTGSGSEEEDFTLFCPPLLYYNSSAQGKSQTKEEDFKSLNLITFADSCSEEDDVTKKDEGPDSKLKHQKDTGKETSGVTPNILGEALKQLPLFNALVAELSQLTGSSSHQPLIVDSRQSWIYKPASIEPWVGHEKTPQQVQVQSLHKTRQEAGTQHLHRHRYCLTPTVNPARLKNNQEETLPGNKSSSRSHSKKLRHGTTKTFNLRLRQVSLLKAKQCETQSSAAKVKTSSKTVKSCKIKSRFSENMETLDSALQSTITLKQKTQNAKQDAFTQPVSGTGSFSHRDVKLSHVPDVDVDSVPLRKDKRHRTGNQSESQSDPLLTEKDKSSCRSSVSESNTDENGDTDYADDFDSLESSDDSLHKPGSSPESSRAKTPKSRVRPDSSHSDSRSESLQKRPVILPVPVKARRSPRRLMSTHIIQPRTHSALNVSSDDDERDAPLQRVSSRKEMTSSDKVEQSSLAESFLSSRGERTESPGNCVQGFSVESISSFEAQEAEELEEELGSLALTKKHLHVSELVASKLPGYTL